MTTAERLQSYYPFDQEVIDRVAEVAEEQAGTSGHRDFLQKYLAFDELAKDTHIMDVRPAEHDPKAALMIHLAMGQPLDPNNLYQIATIAAANPNVRILTAANPSSPAYKAPRYSQDQRKAITRGNFSPLSETLQRYAESNNVEVVDQYGYSFGADVAMEAAASQAFDVPKAVVIEPASVVKRSLLGIAGAFGKSAKALNDYVELSGPGFKSARKESVGMIGFNLGLARLSNLAIARGLSLDGFEGRAGAALKAQPDMKATIAWGTDSELADHAALSEQTRRLAEEFGRVQAMILPDQKHALANDIHLQAAIVTQALAS